MGGSIFLGSKREALVCSLERSLLTVNGWLEILALALERGRAYRYLVGT